MPFGASLSDARGGAAGRAATGWEGEAHIGFPSDAAPLQPAGEAVLGAVAALGALTAVTGCDLQENADPERGEQLFTQNCGSCHALTAAGTNADVGPNLDLAFEAARASGMDQDTIEGVVRARSRTPARPAPRTSRSTCRANLVEGDDAEDVAAYVASVAGVPGIEPPEFLAPEFFATNCGGCHTLSAAGTTGTVGPNLDDVLPGQAPRRSPRPSPTPRRRSHRASRPA